MLAEVWNSSLDETLEFEARVTAIVSGHEAFTRISPVVTFKVTPYIERYLNLWMIGGATAGGWSLDSATPMESIEDEPNGFIWEGILLSGELKFVFGSDEDEGTENTKDILSMLSGGEYTYYGYESDNIGIRNNGVEYVTDADGNVLQNQRFSDIIVTL